MAYEIGDDFDVGDDLIGDDDLEALLGDVEIGARRRRRGMSPQQQQMLAMRAQRGTMLRQSRPTKSREYVLGFDSVSTVAAAGTVNVVAQPQVVFRPERLVVSGAIAASFLINDFKVGKNSQLAASGAVPADAFGPNAFGVRLKCDTAQVSNLITLNVTNISGGALRFTAACFGEAVE
jgi:hypothetical protein